MLVGLLSFARGADRGVAPLVATGLFLIIESVVIATGAILLLNYANRLSSLQYGRSSKVLESALDKLRAFWVYVSIVLIVILAFLAFVVIWVLAVGASFAR